MQSDSIQWQNWQALESRLSGNDLKEWLLCTGSFMNRLETFGVQDAEVNVIQQAWLKPNDEEADQLGLNPEESAFVREVLIQSPSNAWMYARSVIPRATLTDKEIELTQLENRALGTVLFQEKAWQRQSFEFSFLSKNSDWFTKILTHVKLPTAGLWARRSQFHLQEKKLLLTEIFLPSIEKLA